MYLKHFKMEEAGGTPAAPAGTPATNLGTTTSVPASITTPGTPVAPATITTPAPAPATSSWLDSLPDEIKRDPSIQLFKESGIQGLAKSWVSAQALIGKDRVIIPGEKATEQEWAAFHQKLGRPESADKYEFKLPDGQAMDENFAKGFKDIAFKTGMTPKQVQSAVEWYAKEAGAVVQQSKAQEETQLRQSLDVYREKVGGEDKFKARIEQARVAVRALGDPALNEFLDKSGAGSRPEMIEFFAKLSTMMGEDKIRDGTGVAFSDDPANIQKEIGEIESKMYANLDSTHRSEWVQQLSKLYERLDAVRRPT